MKDLFVTYVDNRFQDVPWYVYLSLMLIFCLGAVVLAYHYGIKRSLRYSSRLLCVEYVFLLFSSTVLFRTYSERRVHEFQPFWSYSAIMDGKEYIIPQIILNVAVFVPVGFLLGCGFRKIKWWQATLIGLFVSTTIEVLQFVFNKGYAELDDLMHNTIGCLIGCGMSLFIRFRYTKNRYF